MRLSQYFLPTLKETPSEAQVVSHRLMLRAGMIRQTSAGIYAWMPLGLRVLKNIERVVREEQDKAGAIELLMPTVQSADLWKQSGRYEAYGNEMLRIKDRHEREMLYGPTNEEMITEIFKASARSYRDLPRILYHVQWKFRDEIRPRFGLMRGREFLMKDAYSFDLDRAGAEDSYNRMFVAYMRTFARLGVKALPVRADTGPIGGDLSHEFHILAETGESQVFVDGQLEAIDFASENPQTAGERTAFFKKVTSYYAAADEMHVPENCPVPEDRLVSRRGIEVGHIFYFGTKYSAPFDAAIAGPDGAPRLMEMGSYGIGVSRVAAAIIEACHDEAGIIWPDVVAPFRVGLLNLKPGDTRIDAACEDLYNRMQAAGVEILYDDRDERPGAKFADMDLIGLPWQVIVGPRGLDRQQVELKRRASGERIELGLEEALARVSG